MHFVDVAYFISSASSPPCYRYFKTKKIVFFFCIGYFNIQVCLGQKFQIILLQSMVRAFLLPFRLHRSFQHLLSRPLSLFPFGLRMNTAFEYLLSSIHSKCSFRCILFYFPLLVINSIPHSFLIYSFFIVTNLEKFLKLLKNLISTDFILFGSFCVGAQVFSSV